MMMTSESSSRDLGQEYIIEEDEEEQQDMLEGDIQTLTSGMSNTERLYDQEDERHVALKPVENDTSENYETGMAA